VGLKLDEDRVRGKRERLGLTLAMLAQKAGTSKNTILSAEHGGDIRPTTARKIAEALGTDIADLLGESDSPKGIAPPSVQLTLNGVLAEARRRPTEQEIKALGRWLSYLEQRLDRGNLSRDEIAHELDAANAFGVRKDPAEYPDEIFKWFVRLVRRTLEEGKSFDALQAELDALEAEINRLEATHQERQT
jgi:transcriptional regulator with XRE-family HTH domain